MRDVADEEKPKIRRKFTSNDPDAGVPEPMRTALKVARMSAKLADDGAFTKNQREIARRWLRHLLARKEKLGY